MILKRLRLASEMVRPEAVTFLDKMLKSPDGSYRIEDIMVHMNSPFRDKALRASGLLDTQGVTVAAVRKGERYIFSPSGDEMLGDGDAIILIGTLERIRAIKEIAG